MKRAHKDFLHFAGIAVFVVLFFGLAIYGSLRNWAECRATPHTVFYCLTAGNK